MPFCSCRETASARSNLLIGSLVATIGLCYLIEIFLVPVAWGSVAFHSVVPQLGGPEALALAVGIIGATVMPHAVYLHSGLTQARIPPRNVSETRRIVRASNREVVVALALAGLVNMAMVIMAAGAFHAGHSDVAEIATAYHTLAPLFGPAAAGVFLIALLASGISSSAVGTMAGQMIMQGFVGFTIPVWVRRLVTMAPAIVVVALGVDATWALVISQIVLSIALPLPMIALLMFTRRPDIMGPFANSRRMQAAAMTGAGVVLTLNLLLIGLAFGVPIPGSDGTGSEWLPIRVVAKSWRRLHPRRDVPVLEKSCPTCPFRTGRSRGRALGCVLACAPKIGASNSRVAVSMKSAAQSMNCVLIRFRP